MDSAGARLEIRDLHAYYGRAHVLQGVSLDVRDAPVALLGRNGMGKTTLCQALMGLTPSSGEARFGGVSLIGRKPHEIASLGIGYVPQGRRVFPSLTVDEHLRLMQGCQRARAGRWTIRLVYETFPWLAERKGNGAANLSGGEQQMLAIGRALLLNPRLLIMDEPSEGLAPVLVQQLIATLRALSAEGIALLVVEQRLAVAAAAAQRLAIMVTGRIALESTARDLLADVAAQRRYLGLGTTPVPAGA